MVFTQWCRGVSGGRIYADAAVFVLFVADPAVVEVMVVVDAVILAKYAIHSSIEWVIMYVNI